MSVQRPLKLGTLWAVPATLLFGTRRGETALRAMRLAKTRVNRGEVT